MKRILCLWFPHWPIQRLLVARPELEQRGIVLSARDPRRGEYVVACCSKAQASGIRPGMLRAEASALPQRTEVDKPRRATADRTASTADMRRAVYFQLHDPQADRQTLENLAQRCEIFSPLVGLDHPQHAEGLWLEVASVAPHWGGEDKLAAQVMQRVWQQGYRGRMALADTLGAAWGLVRYGRTTAPNGETNGETNGEHSVLLRVPAGQTPQALRSLPIQALRLSDLTLQLLQRLGIERIEQLLALPRAGLAARLGNEVLQRWDQASGALEEILVPYRPAPRFQARWALESPSCERSTIEQVVQHLCHHVAQQLAFRSRGAMQIRCRLLTASRHPVILDVGLFQPAAQATHLFQLLRMQLESVRLPAAVQAVDLRALTTAPLHDQQSGLWHDVAADHPRQLAGLVDRLSSRLGAAAVCGVRLRAGALPEQAYVTVPLTGRAASAARAAAEPQSTWLPQQRPLHLIDPPQPLEGMWVAPEGPPIGFHYRGQSYHVQQHWGPERIETAWWQGPCVRRDYYRVECTAGCRFWLFRHLADQRWFLHGQFD